MTTKVKQVEKVKQPKQIVSNIIDFSKKEFKILLNEIYADLRSKGVHKFERKKLATKLLIDKLKIK